MGRFSWLGISAVLLFSTLAFGSLPKAEVAVTHFAFGGCNHQYETQEHWEVIAKTKPQFWIWNGDAIYADTLSVAAREKEFQKLKSNSFYAEFIKSTPVLGVWDDHDFGANDADGATTEKPARQKMFLDFIDEDLASTRRTQDGIYGSWRFGPVGKRTKIVLLDARYFRDRPGTRDATILGKVQWDWFEKEIQTGDFEFLIVVSGTQMVPADHPTDKWQNFPKDRDRLLADLDRVSAPVFLISGDRHFGELSQIKLSSGKVVYEGTSSGLTHVTNSKAFPNKLRVGKKFLKKNFALMDLEWDADKLRSAKFRLMHTSGRELFSNVVAP